jgi:hypothetical protein
MLIKIYLSQLDERWRYLMLGTSNITIGEAGCLITCCSMLANTTPDKLNQKLIDVGGYQDGNLLIWSKLSEATNGKLTFNWLNYEYNNDGVKKIIEEEGACIVRVDNNGYMHFVLYIGNGQMIDPLTGQVESTSKYEAVGFADITVKKDITNSQIETMNDNITRKSSFFDRLYHTFNSESINTDLVKEADLLVFISWLKSNVNRAGNYDKVCNYLGFTDSQKTTSENLIVKIKTLQTDCSMQISKAVKEAKLSLIASITKLFEG